MGGYRGYGGVVMKPTWTKVEPQLKDCKGEVIRIGQRVVYNSSGELSESVVESMTHKTRHDWRTWNRYTIKLENGAKVTNPKSIYILEDA
jgi:hypothetical protein